jgi:hypothetical protein
MSNLDDIKKEFESKLKELISIDPSLAKDCMKFYARVKKHGDPNIKLQGGRTKVSASHKKETYRKYYEKKKAEREAEKERLKSLGIETKKKMGRPKKEKKAE